MCKGVIVPDEGTAKALNRLARHQMIERLYSDILMDMKVCEIEGWDMLEYLDELRDMLNTLGRAAGKDNKQ